MEIKRPTGRPRNEPAGAFVPLAMRLIRIARKLTGGELAERMGSSKSTVSYWETGRGMPTTDQVVRIAEALDCSVEDLGGIKLEGHAGTVAATEASE